MEQKFISVANLTLGYIEQNETAKKTLFFIHGNSGSWRTWTYQLDSSLFKNYRLVAIDLPSHGNSSHSNNPRRDYSPVNTGKTMAKAVAALHNNNPFLLVGFSYGTNVVGEMLNEDINPIGIGLIGPCVIGEGIGLSDLLADPQGSIYFTDDMDEERARSFLSARLKSADATVLQTYLDDFLSTKPTFRSTLLETALAGQGSDEVGLLKKQAIPLLVVFGRKDDYLHTNYLDRANLPLWNDRIFRLEKAGHFIPADAPEALNQILLDYAEDRFKANHS